MKIVPDTSTLISNPDFLKNFLEDGKEAVDIILPLTVLKELGNFKHESSERGKYARDFFKYLKQISRDKKLSKGLSFDNNSTLSIELNCSIDIKDIEEIGDNDSKIICVAKRHDAVLYTQDNAMLIVAEAFDVKTESGGPKKQKELYEGIALLEDTDFYIDEIYDKGYVDIFDTNFLENQYVVIQSGQQSVVTRFTKQRLHHIPDLPKSVFKVKPIGIRQKCAFDLLLDDDMGIAGLIGNPGTGKTYLALAAGLDLVLNKGQFKKLIIIKSAVGVGGDNEALGFLPGALNEKIDPIFSNLTGHLKTLLSDNKGRGGGQQYMLPMLRDKGTIELKPVQYIRGENFSDSLIIIDEIQNFSAATVKTLLTRVNYNTSKVIFTGDNEQVDNPYLNTLNNGLYSTVDKLKGKPYFGLISLDKSCRGEITEDLVKLFQ